MSISLARALCVALFAAASYPAHADARSVARPVRPVATPAVRVMIESAEGGAFASVEHRGATFVAGELGEQYVVRLVNDSADRLEVVVAVDGRDVLSGKVGDFKRDRGYVIEPFGEVVIDGFRRSLDHVAAFRFSSVRDSYAVRRGTSTRSRAIGTISVAVFREQARPTWRALAPRAADEAGASTSTPPASRPKKAPAEQLGTEFGETLHSSVIEVPFVRSRATTPDEIHRVQYDSTARLIARGVPIDPPVEPWHGGHGHDHGGWPSAHDDRFAPPPPPRGRGR